MSGWHLSATDIGGIVGIVAGVVVAVERRIGVIRRLGRLQEMATDAAAAAKTAAADAKAAADDASHIRRQLMPPGEPCINDRIDALRARLEDHIADPRIDAIRADAATAADRRPPEGDDRDREGA